MLEFLMNAAFWYVVLLLVGLAVMLGGLSGCDANRIATQPVCVWNCSVTQEQGVR